MGAVRARVGWRVRLTPWRHSLGFSGRGGKEFGELESTGQVLGKRGRERPFVDPRPSLHGPPGAALPRAGRVRGCCCVFHFTEAPSAVGGALAAPFAGKETEALMSVVGAANDP